MDRLNKRVWIVSILKVWIDSRCHWWSTLYLCIAICIPICISADGCILWQVLQQPSAAGLTKIKADITKKSSHGVLASGWDKAPRSYMIYSALFMPPFREGGAVFLLVSLIEQDRSKPKIYTLGLCQASKHSCKETTQCCGGCQLFCLQNRHKLQKTNLQTRNFLFLWTLLLWNFKRFLRY